MSRSICPPESDAVVVWRGDILLSIDFGVPGTAHALLCRRMANGRIVVLRDLSAPEQNIRKALRKHRP